MTPTDAQTIDEAPLIARCQAGHLEDFDPLYRAHVRSVYAFVYRRTMHRETAEDITSVTFMKALERIGTFSGKKGTFIGWLISIARNTVTDHYRTKREWKDIEDVWDLSSDDDVATDASTTLDIEKVRSALKTLDAAKREIVLLRLWDGLPYKDIAAITGKSEGNCKVIFCRAVEQLRKEVPLAVLLLLFLSPINP